MPHHSQSATPKVKDIEPPLDTTRPFMDDMGVVMAGLRCRGDVKMAG